jgi:hypothetical protein
MLTYKDVTLQRSDKLPEIFLAILKAFQGIRNYIQNTTCNLCIGSLVHACKDICAKANLHAYNPIDLNIKLDRIHPRPARAINFGDSIGEYGTVSPTDYLPCPGHHCWTPSARHCGGPEGVSL